MSLKLKVAMENFVPLNQQQRESKKVIADELERLQAAFEESDANCADLEDEIKRKDARIAQLEGAIKRAVQQIDVGEWRRDVQDDLMEELTEE